MFTRLAFAVVLLANVVASADDFRVETKLFTDKDSKQPDSTNITYFQHGRVYDFLTRTTSSGDSDTQLIIFDAPQEKFLMLDGARKVQTEIGRDRLIEMTGSLRSRVSQATDPLMKFSVEPKFTELAGSQADETTFTSAVMNYRVVSFAPPSADAARQYRQFTDAFARLNAVTNPGSLLPFPRLAVNESLGKKNAVPHEVERVILPRNKLLGKPIVHRTVHAYQWSLTDADEARILQAQRWQTAFSSVTLVDFIGSAK